MASDSSDGECIVASQEVEDMLEAESQDIFGENTRSEEEDLLGASQEVENQLESDDVAAATTSQAENRFAQPVSDNYLEEIAMKAEPKNTLKRNQWAVNTFNAWAICRNNLVQDPQKVTSLDVMSPDDLCLWLSKFVCEVRKQNGTEYPPRSLLSLCMGLQGYLRMKRKLKLEILRSAKFERFRQVLDGRMKGLTQMGYGSNKRQAEAFTQEQEDTFWREKLLGDHNARVLLRTIVFLNGKHFALRSGAEHRSLRFSNSQIKLHEENGHAFLEYREDFSKTNQGGLRHLRVSPKVSRIYPSHDPARCHIRLYKLYMSLCPSTGRDNAFYLSPLNKPQPQLWYSRQPVGHNTLQKIVPDLCKDAGIQGHYTNHSLRATAATTLFKGGVDEQLIMAHTGHRSVSGVRTYKRPGEDQKRTLSNILTHSTDNPVPEKKAKTQSTSISEGTSTSVSEDSCPVQFVNCVVNIAKF